MFQTKVVENQTIHFMFNNCFSKIVTFMGWCKNMLQSGRPHMTIWRMHNASWIPTATKTPLRICNAYCFPTATMVARTGFNVTSNVHCPSCWSYILRSRDGCTIQIPYNKILFIYFHTVWYSSYTPLPSHMHLLLPGLLFLGANPRNCGKWLLHFSLV